MKILIDIPKEFEQHFHADRFEDSLHRLSADAHLIAGNYEQETALMLIEALKKAVPVPPHGDLIDRDKLEKDIDKYVGGEESRSRFHHWVQVQHTVIPKSEEA